MARLLTPPPDGHASPAAPARTTPSAEEPAAATLGAVAAALASLSTGAGVIHLVMVPSHLGESTAEGAGFLVAAWAQLALAVALARRDRPGPVLARRVVAVNGALVAAWALSRTVGLPGTGSSAHASTVTIVDATAVAFELALVLSVVALRRRPGPAVPTGPRAALAVPLAVVALTSLAVASPAARDHAAGGHAAGGHPAGGHAAGGHAAGGHDQHGAPGHAHGDAGPADDRGLSLLTSGHDHGTGEVVALDAATQATLDDQLAATGEVIDRYPTAADALAAGFTRQGPFTPGLGTHYIAPATQPVVGTVDRAELSTPVLVYDGPGPDAPLAGLMYTSRSTRAAPEGFAGPNDHWHQHEDVCVVPRAGGGADTPFGVDRGDVTAAMCAGVGGEWIRRIQYMVHVWTVPGHENPDGVFAEVNPAITCPDGTYHEVDWREIGTRTSTCRSG